MDVRCDYLLVMCIYSVLMRCPAISSKEYGQVAEMEGYVKRLIIKWRRSGAIPITCFFVFSFLDAIH